MSFDTRLNGTFASELLHWSPKGRDFRFSALHLPFLTFYDPFTLQVGEVDINTLKIQNRELIVKLTERAKSLETASLQLTESEAARAELSTSISHFSTFMTQVRTHTP